MASKNWIWVGLAGVAGVAGAVYYFQGQTPPEKPAQTEAKPTPTPSPTAASVKFPVPEEEEEPEKEEAPKKEAPRATRAPVPASLEESDPGIQSELAAAVGEGRLHGQFLLKDVIRRVVATVDASLGRQMPPSLSPFRPVGGSFTVTGTGEEKTIGPENDKRYQPYVTLARTVDTKRLVSAYFRYYKLFQTAYAELGAKGYFNDRLIEVVDSALETPEVAGPIPLIQVGKSYKFADPKLEGLPAIQRTLIRMGSENASSMKSWLRDFRARLTRMKR